MLLPLCGRALGSPALLLSVQLRSASSFYATTHRQPPTHSVVEEGPSGTNHRLYPRGFADFYYNCNWKNVGCGNSFRIVV